MTVSFGKWDQHLQLKEMQKWYKLPKSIQAELELYTYSSEHDQPIPAKDFAILMRETVAFTSNSVGGNTLPAHNPLMHFDQVRRNFLVLFDAYYGAAAKTTYLFVRQMVEIAAYTHDCGHRGCTLWVDHKKSKHGKKMPLPKGAGPKVTVEYTTSLMVNDFLKSKGVSLAARVFIMGIHWSSTFGYAAAKARGFDFVPNPQPKTPCHGMMRVSDVLPKEDFEEAIDYGARVNFGEVSATGKVPSTPEEFVRAERGFMDYRNHTMDELDRIAGWAVCPASFRQTVRRHSDACDRIINGDDPAGLALAAKAMKKWLES